LSSKGVGEVTVRITLGGEFDLSVIVFESLLPVIIVIAVGLFLREFKIVSKENWLGIELLSYWLLFPILVMFSLLKMDLSKISLGSITKSYLLAVLVQLVIIWMLRKPLREFLGVNGRSFSTIFQTSTRWNAFIALAIANNFAGDQGLAIVALIMAVTLPVLNVVNIVVLTLCCSDTKPTIAATVINTLKVPIIWGALFGLSLNLAQVPIYEPLIVSFDIIGRAGLGVGLLTIGAGLHLKAMVRPKITVLVGFTAKLILFPLLVFISCLVFQVSGLALQISIISASVATAMNGYVLARQMGGDADLYATTASLQVVGSMFSIPMMLWLISGSV
jgi:malonate transporter